MLPVVLSTGDHIGAVIIARGSNVHTLYALHVARTSIVRRDSTFMQLIILPIWVHAFHSIHIASENARGQLHMRLTDGAITACDGMISFIHL